MVATQHWQAAQHAHQQAMQAQMPAQAAQLGMHPSQFMQMQQQQFLMQQHLEAATPMVQEFAPISLIHQPLARAPHFKCRSTDNIVR